MLRARFDRIFTKTTDYAMFDRQLIRLHRQKADLLRVLDRPEIPLHTNGSENDIRTVVTKRKISGGTVSETGKTARDTMLGLLTPSSLASYRAIPSLHRRPPDLVRRSRRRLP